MNLVIFFITGFGLFVLWLLIGSAFEYLACLVRKEPKKEVAVELVFRADDLRTVRQIIFWPFVIVAYIPTLLIKNYLKKKKALLKEQDDAVSFTQKIINRQKI